MFIARYYDNTTVRVETIEKPAIDSGEVLVQVVACGICGSDTMEWFRAPKAPRILGHEISGIVADSRSDDYAIGDRVVVRNQVPCGACHACARDHHSVCERTTEIQPGGMAEYIRLPREVVRLGLFRLPPQISFAAGTLAEPIACTIHSQALAQIEPQHCVVVIGCGVAGLLHIQVARAKGVKMVIAVDPVQYRREAATRLGVNLALAPSDELAAEVLRVNGGQLADVAVIACGADDAVRVARTVLGRHGSILLFGASHPAAAAYTLNQLFWRNEFKIISSYGAGNVSFSDAIAMIERGAIDDRALITHRIPLQRVQDGFGLVARASESLKVVLEISET